MSLEITMKNMEKIVGKCQVTEWTNCYDDSWKTHIVDEAFAHP